MSSNDRTGRTRNKTSNSSSKIPMLRSRSASLSRPGSRCSRPRSRTRTDSQSAGNSESVGPSFSLKPHLSSHPAVAADDRNLYRNTDGVDEHENRKLPGKSAAGNHGKEMHKNAESTVKSDGNNNSPEIPLPGAEKVSEDAEPRETVSLVVTESLNLNYDGRTICDVAEEGDRASSVDDNIRSHGSFQTSDRRCAEDKLTSKSRRERRSYSLDHSTSWKATR